MKLANFIISVLFLIQTFSTPACRAFEQNNISQAIPFIDNGSRPAFSPKVISPNPKENQLSYEMPIYPQNGDTVYQTPPPFTWPQVKNVKYFFQIISANGFSKNIGTFRNWILLSDILSSGLYNWRVSTKDGGNINHGIWRSFTVADNAVPFVVSDPSSLYLKASKSNHPRSLKSVETLNIMLSKRTTGLNALYDRVKLYEQQELPEEPVLSFTNIFSSQKLYKNKRDIQDVVFLERRRILESAFAGIASGNKEFFRQTKYRALNLASWDPTGSTGFQIHDQAARALAYTLTIFYDWYYDELSVAERKKLLSAILPRLKSMYESLTENNFKIDRYPYNSHGAITLAHVCAISVLLAGEDYSIENFFKESVPRYLLWPVPWGRYDGGYANGTNYACWDITTDSFPVWDIFKIVLDIDFGSNLWVKEYGKFITYFLPPGTPRGMFGDGAEYFRPHVWGLQAQAYADRFPSPLINWYATLHKNEGEDNLLLLMTPTQNRSQSNFPPGTPNALFLPSTGWVAMHSDLSSQNRISVYFKSSPYGSYNHSHADQNSFVLDANGQPLLIDSGYYDFYNSPHWIQWTKQTSAHNAISFDGGTGQLHDTMIAKGKIIRFQTNETYDIVTGDATAAYGGALNRAHRTLLYIRPGTILVFDDLESITPRQWELNFHTVNKMDILNNESIVVRNNGQEACIEIFEGPEMLFLQTNDFPVYPTGTNRPNQWHAILKSNKATNSAQILTLITVNCKRPKVSFSPIESGFIVIVDGNEFTIGEDKSNNGPPEQVHPIYILKEPPSNVFE